MAYSRFHKALRVKVEATITEWSHSIISGQIKDIAEYREACGYIRGLNDALKVCEDLEGDLEQ